MLQEHADGQVTAGVSPAPPQVAEHAPSPQLRTVSLQAVLPLPQSMSQLAAVPQSMTRASQLSVAFAHVTLQSYSAGQVSDASSHASSPAHRSSQENPGGHTMLSLMHSCASH